MSDQWRKHRLSMPIFPAQKIIAQVLQAERHRLVLAYDFNRFPEWRRSLDVQTIHAAFEAKETDETVVPERG